MENVRAALFLRLGQLDRELSDVRRALGLQDTLSPISVPPTVQDGIFRLIAMYGSDFVSVHSADGKFVFASPSCKSLFGWNPEEMVGRSAYEFHHEEDIKRISEDHAKHGQERESAGIVRYRLRTKSEDFKWVETRSSSHTTNESVHYIICITRDIHEQKQAQERALEAERALSRQMAHMAMTDELTRLLNRRAGEARLHEEAARSVREGNPLSIVLFDIDHFKKVNDTHGHTGGDEALKVVAQALSQNVRPYDHACRWGGEEFLLVLPNTPGKEAMEVARRISQVVRQTSIPGVGRITISGGVAEHAKKEHVEALIKRADSGLYSSKGAGRNTVRFASLRAAAKK